MPFDPTERRRVGRTALTVTQLGFGSAPIGGLFTPVTNANAVATVRRAWGLGIRYFDTAPLYGYGAAERRIGAGLAGLPRDELTISTKVGRLVLSADAVPTGADVDRQALDGHENAYYADTGSRRLVFDYSYDGIRRSIDESLARLGLERVDIVYIHDPDDHWKEAIEGAYPALDQLRREGVVSAIGAGMNQSAMLARFAREGDFDVFLVAGRYTLLDQEALADLLPLCVEKEIGIVIGGVMNSGILADPRPGSRFDYAPASTSVVERAAQLKAVCERHRVPLRAAAAQFPLAHPAVVSVVAGVRRIDHLEEYPALLRHPIPADLWAELRAEGLLPAHAPVPA